MAYVNTTQTARYGIVERVQSVMKNVLEAVARRRIYRQTVRELSALSSRDLADLGIHRSMITRVALEAANGK